jgi:hypothetical protein
MTTSSSIGVRWAIVAVAGALLVGLVPDPATEIVCSGGWSVAPLTGA